MRVVAVFDVTFDEDHDLRCGVPYLFKYERLVQEELYVPFVCSPNYLSSEVTIAGLKRSLHLFCEKPPGCDLADLTKDLELE